MTELSCNACKGSGWTCEQHPALPAFHDDCAGPGIPCECNPKEDMPPGTIIHDCEHVTVH